MTKQEFVTYVDYLEKIFNTKINKEKEALASFYKAFENIHPTIAKEMAEKYLTTETGYFKWAKLLEYKTICLNGKEIKMQEPATKCEICNGKGIVFVEERRGKRIYEMGKRCTCKIGQSLPGYIKEITEEDIEGMYVDFTGTFRINRPIELPIDSEQINTIMNRVREGIRRKKI